MCVLWDFGRVTWDFGRAYCGISDALLLWDFGRAYWDFFGGAYCALGAGLD